MFAAGTVAEAGYLIFPLLIQQSLNALERGGFSGDHIRSALGTRVHSQFAEDYAAAQRFALGTIQ